MGPLAGVLGQGLGLAGSLFGTGTNSQQNQTQTSGTNFRAQDVAGIDAATKGFEQQTGQFQNLANQLAGQVAGTKLQTDFGQINRTGISAPQFSQAPDALAIAQLNRGQEALNAGASAQQRGITQQFGGTGTGQVLGRLASSQAALNANPLASQVAQNQSSRNIAEQGLIQQGQIANQQFQGQDFGQNLQAALAGNQARTGQAGLAQQALGIGSAGLTSQQNLLSQLGQIGQLFGQQTQTTASNKRGRSGGLFS